MGSFFTNYQVRHENAGAVRDALVSIKRDVRAYISPAKNGWVTVYEEESDTQDDKVIRRIAMGLSRELSCGVFAFLVHDSDVLLYWLYRNGQIEDEFNSSPEYFGDRVDDET